MNPPSSTAEDSSSSESLNPDSTHGHRRPPAAGQGDTSPSRREAPYWLDSLLVSTALLVVLSLMANSARDYSPVLTPTVLVLLAMSVALVFATAQVATASGARWLLRRGFSSFILAGHVLSGLLSCFGASVMASVLALIEIRRVIYNSGDRELSLGLAVMVVVAYLIVFHYVALPAFYWLVAIPYVATGRAGSRVEGHGALSMEESPIPARSTAKRSNVFTGSVTADIGLIVTLGSAALAIDKGVSLVVATIGFGILVLIVLKIATRHGLGVRR